MRPARSLVVSVHDVSPRTRVNSAAILQDLVQLGVPCASLLVIPDHHHRGHFLADADFCTWLRGLSSSGHEMVIHGYFHTRVRRLRETTAQKLVTRFYTADEGEFFDLEYDRAVELVTRAVEDFRQLEISPRGFIAPAWLLGTEAERALRELGIGYTTRLGSVVDLQTPRTFRSQSLVWSVRSAWRRQMSRAWNARLFSALQSQPLLRISIHPCDRSHPAIWSQITRLILRALEAWEPLTYERWLARQRVSF